MISHLETGVWSGVCPAVEFLQSGKSLHKSQLAIGFIHTELIQTVSSPTGQNYSKHSGSYSSTGWQHYHSASCYTCGNSSFCSISLRFSLTIHFLQYILVIGTWNNTSLAAYQLFRSLAAVIPSKAVLSRGNKCFLAIYYPQHYLYWEW